MTSIDTTNMVFEDIEKMLVAANYLPDSFSSEIVGKSSIRRYTAVTRNGMKRYLGDSVPRLVQTLISQ